jgi:hypothetical protein
MEPLRGFETKFFDGVVVYVVFVYNLTMKGGEIYAYCSFC